jgi:intracellular multiplication protein IcmD
MLSVMRTNKSKLLFILSIVSLLVLILFPDAVLAAAPTGGGGLPGVKTAAEATSKDILTIIKIVSLVAGVGFILTSLFKFDQHKKNPTQIPMSQPLTLLVIGACLMVLPYIVKEVSGATGGSGDKKPLSGLINGDKG